MALRLQILQRTSRATRTPHLLRLPALQSLKIVPVLLIPLLHHKETCSMHIVLDPTLAGTRDIAAGMDTLAHTNLPLLLAILCILVVLPRALVSVITVNQATSVVHCRQVSIQTKKMTVSQLLSNFFLAASAARLPGLLSQSLFQRTLLLCLTSLHSI